jgi:hypothetical protein
MGLFDQISSVLGDDNLQRFAGGHADFSDPNSEDHQQFQRMVAQTDQSQLQHVFTQAARHLDSQEYAEHITPGAHGTDPLGSVGHSGVATIASLLMRYLTGFVGGDTGSLMTRIPALRTTDPEQMDTNQVAALAQYTQYHHPDLFGRVAAQLGQQHPDLLHAFMGRASLASAASALASQFLKNR